MSRDAFGNPIDQDPLAGLASNGPRVPGVPGGGPPRRWPAIVVVLVAVVLIGVATAGAGLLLVGDEEDDNSLLATTAVASGLEAKPAPEPTPAPEEPAREPATPAEPAAPPRGLQPGSLLRHVNFAVALPRLRAAAQGRPRNLRVEAERIDVQVVLRDGRLRSAQARWDGEIRVISTTSAQIGALPSFSWSAINRGAPQRIVRSATGRARKPASVFNYAVLLDAAGLRWSAFLKTGEGFLATSSGRVERQISGG